MRDIPSLTAIRGLAAVAVVWFHLYLTSVYRLSPAVQTRLFDVCPTLVDFFFVLSGFILAQVYEDLRGRDLGDYALRRALRIYPLHLSVIGVMVICTAFSVIWVQDGPVLWQAHEVEWKTLPLAASLLYPYFGLADGYWNPPSWTMGVELSCYVGLPVGLVLLRRLPPAALGAIALLAAGGVLWAQTEMAGSWAGLSCIVRGWSGFWLGVPLGLLALRLTPPRAAVMLLEVAGVLGIAGAIACDYGPLIPVAAGTLVWGMSYEGGYVARLLSLRPVVYLGKISFSIYVLHMLLLHTFWYFWPQLLYPASLAVTLLRYSVFMTVLLTLAGLSYQYIERPGMRFHRHLRRLSAIPAAG